eukprot:1143644-Pelagomonas_calceolata.AAC.3
MKLLETHYRLRAFLMEEAQVRGPGDVNVRRFGLTPGAFLMEETQMCETGDVSYKDQLVLTQTQGLPDGRCAGAWAQIGIGWALGEECANVPRWALDWDLPDVQVRGPGAVN